MCGIDAAAADDDGGDNESACTIRTLFGILFLCIFPGCENEWKYYEWGLVWV